jgi:hypothetical protein
MIISVIDAKLVKDFTLHLQFENGESGTVDLKDVIFKDKRKIFTPLKNAEYFKKFTLDNWTVVWPNEFGFAPEFLYELAIKQNKKLQKQKL